MGGKKMKFPTHIEREILHFLHPSIQALKGLDTTHRVETHTL
jgi:hypothetical protein